MKKYLRNRKLLFVATITIILSAHACSSNKMKEEQTDLPPESAPVTDQTPTAGTDTAPLPDASASGLPSPSGSPEMTAMSEPTATPPPIEPSTPSMSNTTPDLSAPKKPRHHAAKKKAPIEQAAPVSTPEPAPTTAMVQASPAPEATPSMAPVIAAAQPTQTPEAVPTPTLAAPVPSAEPEEPFYKNKWVIIGVVVAALGAGLMMQKKKF